MTTHPVSRQRHGRPGRSPRRRHYGRGAELAAVAGLGLLAGLAALVAQAGYDGIRGLNPYTIQGVRYEPYVAPDYAAVGVASWYGRPFHGRPTSTGEIYDQEAFTAAHKTLPLGTRVKVTNLDNGRSVLLTVNDRGPFVDGRLIDVSRRAARKLGFLEQGLTEVRVQALVSPLR